MVRQQVEGASDKTTLEALVEADEYRTELLEEQERIEAEMDAGRNMEENAQRLSELAVELDVIDADNAEQRALEILRGLSFSKEMIHCATASLSGGWRMRLALAQALFVPYIDLLLLDEVTNHLDLHGMAWLENYLTDERRQKALTMICVSHDRSFLDSVCTDVIVMEHKRLAYHSGNYSDYRQKMQEKASREAQILDAAERQRTKAEAFVQKQQQQSKKSADPNKQRQAKMIKEKKMERIGNYREDGKRYKLNSLKKLSEDYVRLAQKVVIEADDPVVRIRLPDPTWPPSVAGESPLISLEDVSFAYAKDNNHDANYVLRQVTMNVTKTTKVAVVGRNGCGKTTLLKLLLGDLSPSKGAIRIHPNIRIKSISQYSVEELEQFAHLTVVQYAEEYFASGSASSEVISKASGNVRQYLGAFGLGGSHAHRQIAKLSGGERMRLCFATALADSPHVLLLDESTNHVDLETLDSLAEALCAFKGAIVMVSHNQGFLSNFCNELWAVDEISGTVSVSKNDTESFDDLFSQYRSRVLSSGGKGALNRQRERQVKAGMARQAAKQRATATTNTALL
jgi:ATPase subunit of ABC transporter with duplicated ATPase domains